MLIGIVIPSLASVFVYGTGEDTGVESDLCGDVGGVGVRRNFDTLAPQNPRVDCLSFQHNVSLSHESTEKRYVKYGYPRLMSLRVRDS